MIADVGESDNAIPLPNVSSNVLKKVASGFLQTDLLFLIFLMQVLEWCEHHKKDPEPVATSADDFADDSRKKTTEVSFGIDFTAVATSLIESGQITDWDQKFIAVDQEMLFEVAGLPLSPGARMPTTISVCRSFLLLITLISNRYC